MFNNSHIITIIATKHLMTEGYSARYIHMEEQFRRHVYSEQEVMFREQ